MVRSGPLHVVADARIDDRKALCAALGLDDAARPSAATLIAKAWERWGSDALDRLVGDFAFALFDRDSRTLFLARDVMGRRPLHYRQHGANLTLASLPTALPAPGRSSEVDLETLARYHAMLSQTGAETFFHGVRRVEPGTLVSWRRETLTAHRYWTPPRAMNDIAIEEAVEETWRLLKRAVVDRAEPDAPLGLQLSGGMDSSSVAAAAGDLGLDTIAVTGVASARADPPPRGFEPEDGHIAALTSARFPSFRHRLCVAEPRPWTDLMADWNATVDQPIRSLENVGWIDETARAAAAEGARTLCGGDFGNNSLSYDGTALFADYFRSGRWLELSRQSRAFRAVTGARRRGVASYAVGPFLPKALWRAIAHAPSAAARLTSVSLFKPGHPVVRQMLDRARDDGQDMSQRPPRSTWSARAGELSWVDNALLGKAILARSGVTLTDPTADRRLIEFTLSLPAHHWLNAGRTRALARRLLEGRVPDEVVNPAGRGFQGADWRVSAEQSLEGLRDEIVLLRQTPFGDMLNLDEMDRMLAGWPAAGWSEAVQQQRYRFSLLHAIGAGNFARIRSGHAFAP